MPWLPVPLSGRAAPAADPDAIRAAREEAGWTQEQLADAAGVLPVEVAAWETGALPARPDQVEFIRWYVRRAAYDREQAERDEACPWMAERRARFAALEEGEPFQDWWVERAVAAHRRDCPACRQALALAGDPAPPGPPLPSGPLARLLWGEPWLPPALRLPAHSLAVGVFFGAGMAAIDGLLSWGWTWSASPEGFLWSSLGAAWFWFTWGTLRPLADREPVKAGRIQAAALTVPALLAWGALGSADLANPLLWGAGALVYWLLAGMLGVIFDPDIDEATRQAVYPDVLPRDAGARGGGETDREAAE